jgi:murein DD-endopeptidase MepM/ murein hydrolase activator NlpD
MIRKTKKKVLINWLGLILINLALSLVMFPYQLFRVFVPKKSPGRPGSHPLSKIFKKTFEGKRVKRFVGVGLLIGLMFSGLLANIVAANEGLVVDETIVYTPPTAVVTQTTLVKPVEGVLAQSFSGFHRGVDILAPFGAQVNSIAGGQVIEASFNRLGWGNTIVVEHADGLQSRYAHLNEVLVITGDHVAQGQGLGTIGLTGWTTGPHLHLEIYQNGRSVDPGAILPEYLRGGFRLAQVD